MCIYIYTHMVSTWSHADNCPCGFRHPWQFWHSNFVNPSSNFDTWLRCKCLLVVVSCFRWPFCTVFYNVLCISFATSGWRAKVVFLFRLHCRLTCVSCHDLPQLLGQVATVWQIASPNKTPHIKHELSANATMPFVFDMQALRQSVFQALPPSIYTLCTCYDKSRFFPGFHFLGKLMFVVFDMEFLHLWFFLGAPRGPTPSSMIT